MTERTYDDWFREVVASYRGLEFFVGGPFRGLSDIECQQLIEQRNAGSWYSQRFHELRVDLPSLEAWVVAEDRNRIWQTDAESVYGEAKFYEQAVQRLGEISRCLFSPQNPTETWHDIEGVDETVIHLEFLFSDMQQHLWIRRQGDFANVGIIAILNELVQNTGQAFRQYGDSQDWYVCLQTDAECAAMCSRGFHLYDMPPLHGVLGYPGHDFHDTPSQHDRWLFFARGIFRHGVGDQDGAWEDWNQSAAMGVPDLYSRVERILNSADEDTAK